MKMKSSLLGLFLLVVLLAAACGPATSTPEAMMDEGSTSKSQDTTEAMMDEGDHAAAGMDEDESDEMTEGDSEPAMDMDGSDDMMEEDSEASMDKDDSDDMMEGDSESVADKDDSDDMMEEDSEASMDKDDSVAMMEGDSESAMNKDDSDDTMEENSESAMENDDSESMAQEPEAEAMLELPDWFGAQLTDVNSGEVLTVADLRGKVVLVETMAIWCSNCLRQQREIKALHEALGMRDDLVTLVLDIDPNEDADNLRAYADKHGFDWTYAVAPREVAREIGQLHGDQFLNPPSTPMLIIDQHGEVHLLPFGRKTVQDLQDALEPFLAAGM
jgi:hypothetical protein